MAGPHDTTGDAWSRQLKSFRAMPPQDRLRLALTMTDELHAIARAGIRARHPDWTASQVQAELEELVLGVELARTARRGRIASSR
jgi:hypothetical protein